LSVWGEMEDEMYEEIMPDEDEEESDEEGGEGTTESAENGEGEVGGITAEDTAGLKTPGEG
jgi:hypothetical protein